ncbi:kinase-like domain-containing protein [Rhizophagus diaphanus]|nr:kinase-like domain-containing protein [Rhizophagus diaphanus] [Rhizophagus sp. MUCL 43196]
MEKFQVDIGHFIRDELYNAKLVLDIASGKREKIIDGTPEEYKCWNYESQKRPNMQQVVSTLNQLGLSNNFQDNNPNDNNGNAIEWIKNALNNKVVNFIPFNELTKSEFFKKGGFGYVMKATIWTKTGNYVVYKKLTNTNAVKYDILDAFIHELKIHLHFDYCDRIIRCLGISQDVTTKEYLLVMQYANGGDLRSYLKENVLHRDLHSKNIVIHENNAKIIDFDIYSFGVLMWEISSGCLPFKDCITENEKNIIKCWDQDPNQRPIINKVLEEFEKMGFGINVKNKIIEDNSQALKSTSSLYLSNDQ